MQREDVVVKEEQKAIDRGPLLLVIGEATQIQTPFRPSCCGRRQVSHVHKEEVYYCTPLLFVWTSQHRFCWYNTCFADTWRNDRYADRLSRLVENAHKFSRLKVKSFKYIFWTEAHSSRVLHGYVYDDNYMQSVVAINKKKFSIRNGAKIVKKKKKSAEYQREASAQRPLCFSLLWIHPTPWCY